MHQGHVVRKPFIARVANSYESIGKISTSWPKAIADAGGIFELAKVIIQEDPSHRMHSRNQLL